MSATHTSFIYASILYLILTALMIPYCGYCIYRFISIAKQNWNEKYFRHRHPYTTIAFLFCFFIVTFLVDPLEVILGIIAYENTSRLEIIDIMYDLQSVILFAIFMCRVWYLFSDWSLHHNMSSWIWKREINPLETNCIIKYRQIFGNKKCCYLFIFFILFIPIIIILDIIPIFFFKNGYQILFRIAIVLLFISFTLFILLSSLKHVLDVYNIRKELLLEISIFGGLLLFSEIFSNLLLLTSIINHTQQILLLSIMSTITGITVIYIGTNWVFKKFNHYKLFQSIGQFAQHKNKQINTDDLITILNTQQGFESFLIHMVNELQLEKMLFLIEILQYKQEIKNRLINLKQFQLSDFNKTSDEYLKLNYILNDIRVTETQTNDNTDTLILLQAINLQKLEIPHDPRITQWSLYQFAVHLYDKYIEDGAALQLNLTNQCERFIYSYFRARTMNPKHTPFATPSSINENVDDAGNIETIHVLKGVDENENEDEEIELVMADDKKSEDMSENETDNNKPMKIPDSVDIDDNVMDQITGVDGIYGDENINVIYDLFRLYDMAVYEIWNNISNEIFNRFKITSEYGTIYEKIYNIKDNGQANIINGTFNKKGIKPPLVGVNSLSINS